MQTVAGVGGSLLRARPEGVKLVQIPLPPLEEQKRVAAILDQADALRRLRRRALDRLNTLGQAIFHEMFGVFHDSFENWPLATVGELIRDAKIGIVRGASEMSDDAPVPYLRMDSIGTNGGLRLSGLKRVEAATRERKEYSLQPGDLLFNTRNSRDLVGKTAVVREPFGGVYNNNILRCRFGPNITGDFLDAFLRSRQGSALLDSVKSGTTSVFAIYQRSLMSLKVPCPPGEQQAEYTRRLAMVFVAKEQSAAAWESADSLFASLQHRAFRGEL